MKKFIETANLLKRIKAEDLDKIYDSITYKAAEWAVGGYLPYANKLLEDLWVLHSADTGNVRRELEGLQIMWQIAGNFPAGIPFAFRDVEEIENENWDDIRLGSLLLGESTAAVLSQLEREIQQTEGFRYGTLSAGAAILSLAYELVPEGEKFIHYWGLGYMKNYNYLIGYLTRNEKTSSLLLQGVLSSVLELTEEKCRSEYEALSAALKKRKESRRALIYGDQSWASILKKISLLAIEQDPELYSEDRISSKWLGNDPATEEDILAAEARIGMQLPADYRAFLKVANGFASHGYTTPSLVRAGEIDWLSVLDEDLVEFVENILEWSEDKYAGLSKNCLLVSGPGEEEQVLLFPTRDKGWECWKLVLPGGCGETWFPGFRYYMEHQLYFLECRPFS